MAVKNKVFAYVTHCHRLLVFTQPGSPEAGIQVPAGTLREAEDPAAGVMREVREETGLEGLKLVSFLGQSEYPIPGEDEVHRRWFYHIECCTEPPARWRHVEMDPSEGDQDTVPFDLFWVDLPDAVPALAPGHDRMLPRLLSEMGLRA